MVWRWSNGTPPTLPLRSVLPGGMLLVATAATLKGDPAGGRHRHPEAETIDGVALVERHAPDAPIAICTPRRDAPCRHRCHAERRPRRRPTSPPGSRND